MSSWSPLTPLSASVAMQIGDLYYDSGDPEIGLYAMDTQGNLYNFYNDFGGERKITPVSLRGPWALGFVLA